MLTESYARHSLTATALCQMNQMKVASLPTFPLSQIRTHLSW